MKDWWKSKTFWFNVAYLIGLVASAVLVWFGYDQFRPSEDITALGAILLAMVNLILRYFFTKTALR